MGISSKYISGMAVKSLYDSEQLWRKSEWEVAAKTMRTHRIEDNAHLADIVTRVFSIDKNWVNAAIDRLLRVLDIERIPLRTLAELAGNMAFLTVNETDVARKKELELIYYMLIDQLAVTRP